jgi:protein-disulfide isomerase
MKGKTKSILISVLIGLIAFPAITLGGTLAISLIQGKTPEESIQILAEEIDSLLGRVKELEEKQSKMETQLAVIAPPAPASPPLPAPGPEIKGPIPEEKSVSPLDNLKPISDKDHILGNPDAPIAVITFIDLECPFCKRFHSTMYQIVDEYGGKVKWVIRNLPLEELHSKAKTEAIAAECAADLGGNEKFWQYINRLFEITPSNDGLDLAELPKIAEYVGLNKTQFETCLVSGKFDQLIDEEIQDGTNSGAQGTPYSIIIGPKGKKSVIPGALSYKDVKKMIDDILVQQ